MMRHSSWCGLGFWLFLIATEQLIDLDKWVEFTESLHLLNTHEICLISGFVRCAHNLQTN